LHLHFDLIRLHLPQIKLTTFYQMLMDLLTVFSSLLPPALDCPLLPRPHCPLAGQSIVGQNISARIIGYSCWLW
jgi:hypothetical protein